MNNTIDVQVCCNQGMFPCTYKTVVLKPNIINDKNILNQGMMNIPNTKYVIKYDFLLSDAIVEKTANVVSTNVSQCGNPAYATAISNYNAAHEAWIEADNAYTNDPNDTTLAAKNAAYAALEAAQLTLNGTPQYYYFASSAINVKKGQHITIPEGCALLNDTKTGIASFDVAPNDTTVYIGSATTGSYNYKIQNGIEIPANCLIEFDGGSISDGALVGDETILIFDQEEEVVLKNVELLGTFEYSAGGSGGVNKSDNVNGMATITLKKNKSFSSQLTQTNTIYRIMYDFDSGGEEVTIPENCVLEFDGGSLKNGTIVGQNTGIYAGNCQIFDNITLSGTWRENRVNVQWFGAKNDIDFDSTDAFKAANRNAWSMSHVSEDYQTNGVISEIVIDIPSGNYYVKGTKILGSIRNENEYPVGLRPSKYTVNGNDSIIFWEVENKEDILFWVDYTITRQYFHDFNIKVITNDIVNSKGIVFEVGNTIGPNNEGSGNASNGRYDRISVVLGKWRGFTGGQIYKIFNVKGNAACDLALVNNCTFSYFENVWYNNNPEAVGWVFKRCNFFSPYINSVYFLIKCLYEYLIIEDCSFSVMQGQIVIKYDSIEWNNILIGTSKDNIIFRSNRIETYEYEGFDYLTMFMGNAGCFKAYDLNYTSGPKSTTTTLRFLIDEAGTVELHNCFIPKCLLTFAKATTKSTGNTIPQSVHINNCSFTGNLYLNGYDWNNDELINMLMLYASNTAYRYGEFRDCKIKELVASFDILNYSYNGYYSQRNISFFGVTSDPNSRSSFNQYFKLPPFSVIQKVELLNKPYVGATVKKIRLYFGDKSNNKYVEAQIKQQDVEKMTVFEGSAFIFDSNLANQKIYAAYINSNGTEAPSIMGGNLVFTYTPLRQKQTVSEGTIYVNQTITCAPHRGTTDERPTGIANGGVLDISKDKGFSYYDTTINRQLFVYAIDNNGIVTWKDTNFVDADTKFSGTFTEKPQPGSMRKGFAYLCTDRQTAEGQKNGIMIFYNGLDHNLSPEWIDALGRVVS